jgi:ornithine decarboxylase
MITTNQTNNQKNKPYFTLSKSVILSQYNKLIPISDIISYSSKTNPLVTNILEQNTNSMFSVHLINELKNIKDKSKIQFLAQAWNDEQIKFLINQNINWFVVDNLSDLNTFLTYIKNNPIIIKETNNKETQNKKINLLLRLKLKENSLRTEKFFVFGIPSTIINQKIQEITNNEQLSNQLDLGIHFHRKTQNMAEWNLEYEISNLFTKETLSKINYLNIGGGLPSNYANTNVKVIDSIIKKIQSFKQYLNNQNIKLIIEPGRFIAAPAGKLHTTILAIHDNNIIVNASVYNSDLDALIVPVKLLVEGEYTKEESKINQEIKPCVIKGITPCSMDLFRYRVYLKTKQPNQKITFKNAGAYNFTTTFCDLEKIETKLIE